MKALVAFAKVDFGTTKAAAALAYTVGVSDGVEITASTDIDWLSVMRTEGSWDAAYRWSARQYDILILVQTDAGGIARGQYTMWQEFVRADKPTLIYADGVICKVAKCTPLPGRTDWKHKYAEAEVITASAERQ